MSLGFLSGDLCVKCEYLSGDTLNLAIDWDFDYLVILIQGEQDE